MPAWLRVNFESRTAQLVSVALASGVTVASVIFGVQALRRRIALEDLKASIPNIDEFHDTENESLAFEHESKMLTRCYSYLITAISSQSSSSARRTSVLQLLLVELSRATSVKVGRGPSLSADPQAET